MLLRQTIQNIDWFKYVLNHLFDTKWKNEPDAFEVTTKQTSQ